jgi:Arc/MetJ-type ribon-helix-helix transcriptional regulator
MVRTQIYLTEEEREGIDAIAKSTGKKQSEVIREAVDRFLNPNKRTHREAILKDAAGMWRDRSDLPDFGAARRSWDRG